jgi:flagellar biosynthesis protein FliR
VTAWAVTFLLFFPRVGALFSMLPLFSSMGVPKWAGLLVSLVLSALVTMNGPMTSMEPQSSALVFAILREFFLGISFGIGVQAAFAALAVGSDIIAGQMALSMATIADPMTKSHGTVIGTLASWLATLVFIESNLHGKCVEIVAASFQRFPPGEAPYVAGAGTAAIQAVGGCIALGIQLAGPLVLMLWLVHLFIALLAKLAPRMQVFFSLGVTVNSAIGMMMFAASLPWMLTVHASAVSDAIDALAAGLTGR